MSGVSWQILSGVRFNPFDPNIDDIHIQDIAEALSKICRFNGHVRSFYSVAQHSILLASQVSDEAKLFGLMHDAQEAYFADIVSPIKAAIPEIQIIEQTLATAIEAKFFNGHVPDHVREEVRAADLRMLATEKEQLLNPAREPWEVLRGVEAYDIKINPWLPFIAGDTFRRAFRRYGGQDPKLTLRW